VFLPDFEEALAGLKANDEKTFKVAFPKDYPERKGLPKKMRQLTTDEIADELIDLYPEPFAYLQEDQWRQFFGILLEK